MRDLVERLRRNAESGDSCQGVSEDMTEAANEIERLRDKGGEMKYTAEEVRAIAKRLHDDITVADGDALMASDMLTAYAERIEADARPVAQGESAWLERLKDPATAHALMLRGVIAVPSVRSMVDLRGEVPNGEDVQLLRIAELQEQLAAQPRAVPDGWSSAVSDALAVIKDVAQFHGQLPIGVYQHIQPRLAALLTAVPQPGESA